MAGSDVERFDAFAQRQSHGRELLNAIAQSIELAHQEGPSSWGVRLKGNNFMLKVGPHEVFQFQLSGETLQLIVDRPTVPTRLRGRDDVEFTGDKDCYGKRRAPGYYRSNHGSEACGFDFDLTPKLYWALYASHREVVGRAARLRRHNTTTEESHSSALVEFIGAATGNASGATRIHWRYGFLSRTGLRPTHRTVQHRRRSGCTRSVSGMASRTSRWVFHQPEDATCRHGPSIRLCSSG